MLLSKINYNPLSFFLLNLGARDNDQDLRIFLRQNQRPNVNPKTLTAKAEEQIVKTFGFERILQPSVDHW